jgi:hypothetical protein
LMVDELRKFFFWISSEINWTSVRLFVIHCEWSSVRETFLLLCV